VSNILFVMLHPGFVRYYEDAINALAAAGHRVHVAFETTRDKLNESDLPRRLAAGSDRITCGTTPPRVESVRAFLARSDRTATRGGEIARPGDADASREDAWESLATTVRLLADYLRFFEPRFTNAHKLRDRAEKRLPRIHVRAVRLVARAGRPARRALGLLLYAAERLIPVHPPIAAFVGEHRPDLLLVTPLIELGSQQVDYVKAARALGVRSALCVASWDNLTSKGLVRVTPDHVVVWNDAQKTEAVSLHDVPPERVVITGAQLFDWWFDARPSRSREEFCRAVGLDPALPFVLYVGSSMFIAPDEVPFAQRWIGRLRTAGDRVVASVGVLVRPHPANSRQWRTFDAARFGNVTLWPPIGSDPNSRDFRRDYFDSMHHCAAVVGINTSAQIEAGIVGRSVFTIEAPEFAHAQAGTLHFHHLVDESMALVQTARTLDEHISQLASTLRGEFNVEEANRRFVRAFIRPHGDDAAATPVFVRAIETMASLPRPHVQPDRWWAAAGRVVMQPVARLARLLAEDRPVWVYIARPFVTAGVWLWAVGFIARPLRRGVQRAWRDTSQRLTKRRRRANKAVARAVKNAGSVARRVVGRA